MPTPPTILLPTDYSPASLAALWFAVRFARGIGATLRVVHVVPFDARAGAPPTAALERWIPSAASDVVRGHSVRPAVSPDVGILQEIDAARPDLVIMGTHRGGGLAEWLLGSVTECIVRMAPLPVLTINTKHTVPGAATTQADRSGAHRAESSRPAIEESAMKLSKILCPVDFSAPSHAALEHANALALRTGAELVVMHAVEPIIYPVEYGMVPVPAIDLETTATENAGKQLERLLADHTDPSLRTGHKVIFGRAAEAICDEAANGYDLIVLATHGRTGLKHLLLGSVAERVVRLAPCPVLSVKSPR